MAVPTVAGSGGNRRIQTPVESAGSEAPAQGTTREPGWTRFDALLLFFLFGLALGFRLFRLDHLSLTCDEYHTIILEPGTPFSEYWAFARSVNPDHVPLYFVLSYLWGTFVGTELAVQRMFPVIASCLLIFPVYSMGRRWMGGRWAGFLACLYLAVAPTMIWHGQYLRTNALLLLVAACSLWSFMHAADGGARRWWAMNWAFNLLMLLLHVVGSLMLLAQGLYLLLTGRWRAMLAWGVSNALVLLPWFLLNSAARLETLGDSAPIAGISFFGMLLGGDFLTLNVDTEREWFGGLPGMSQSSHNLEWALAVDAARALLMLGLFAVAVSLAWRNRRGFNAFLLVLLVAFVPILFLRVVSLTWISVEQTSHSIVAFIGLALLLGTGLAAIRGRAARAGAIAVLLVPLISCAYVVAQRDTRPDNLAVSELVRERGEGLPVVVIDCCWVPDIILPLLLAANLGVDPDQIGDAIYLPPDDAPYQLRVVHTLQSVLDLIESRPGMAPLPESFIVVAGKGSVLGRKDLFEKYMRKLGVRSEHHEISNYRVWLCHRELDEKAVHHTRFFSRYDYRGYMERAGFVPESETDWRRARRALRRGVGGWAFESYSHEHYMMMLLFVAELHPRLAAVLSRDAIARYGASSNLLLALGLSLVADGKQAEARAPLEEFLSLNDVGDARFADMVRALLADNWDGYRAALEVFVDRRFICPSILRRIADIPSKGPIRPEDFDCVDCPWRIPPERLQKPIVMEEVIEAEPTLPVPGTE